MKSGLIRLGLGLTVLGTLIGFQNCSKVKVGFEADPASQSVNANGNTCNNTELQTITTPIRLLVIVDLSGSNADDNEHDLSGTDNDKVMRLGSIRQFYSDYGNKTNFSWGLIGFKKYFARAYINSGDYSQPTFSNSPMVVQAAINDFAGAADDGATPYKKALEMAKNLISQDSAAPADTKYILVFLSDGMPTDYEPSPFDPITPAGRAALLTDVSNLMDLKPGKITLSTVYYGEDNPTATTVMQSMASTGGGQFLDVNANPAVRDFLINSVVTIPGHVCPAR